MPPEIAAGRGRCSPARRVEQTRASRIRPADRNLARGGRPPPALCTRCAVRSKSGEVHEINDLITLNLDIRQFAQDLIESLSDPELLRAFWKALNDITVLDPTCGSGAFLFAALNILEPLYEACLERMECFLGGVGRQRRNTAQKSYRISARCWTQVEQHPNRRYFILKSIIVNNLFGVDIMEEAVEICKLRLFLKLVAQVDDPRLY